MHPTGPAPMTANDWGIKSSGIYSFYHPLIHFHTPEAFSIGGYIPEMVNVYRVDMLFNT
jgi:hypothetical protein